MTEATRRVGAIAHVVAALSFIPLLGVPFGFVSILWGLITRRAGRWTLVTMGTAGIALTVVAYASLFYCGFMQRGGMFDELRSRLAQQTITNLVKAIEFYKVQNGRYPDSLETLRQSLTSESAASIVELRQFHYEVVDADRYRLVGLGPDGVPFTGDDLRPVVKPAPGSKLGLMMER